MNINDFLQSKLFKGILCGLVVFIIILMVFWAGMIIGFKKAGFSYRWGDNYHRNFAGPRDGFLRDFMGKEFINAHGIFGQIIKIGDSDIVINSQGNTEKIVVINNKTIIERFREAIKLTDLKVDDQVVIIGEPNNLGQIEAKFIRLMLAPPKFEGREPLP